MFSQIFRPHPDFCLERSFLLFSTFWIKHGYIVLLQILPLFYNLRDWKQCFVYINWCKQFVYLAELESFNILIDSLALCGYVCRLTPSHVQCSLHDLRKPGAFLFLYPGPLCDHFPICLPPKWLVLLAAFIRLILQCIFPLTLLYLWEAFPDSLKELCKGLLNGRSVQQDWW